MHYSVESINPVKAKAYLATNHANRPVTPTNVGKLAAAMKAGDWALNGEALKFDDHGNLIDGQHRLHAVIAANATIETLVIRGIARETFNTIDTGRVRSAGDVLAIHGFKNVNILAAAAKLVCCHDAGNIYSFSNMSVSNKAIEACVENNPGLIPWCSDHTTKHIYSASMRAAISYLYVRKGCSEERVKEFWERLGDGVGLTVDSPVRQLRERFLQIKSKTGENLNRDMQLALGIKCMAAHLMGAPMKVLRISKNEVFPTI